MEAAAVPRGAELLFAGVHGYDYLGPNTLT